MARTKIQYRQHAIIANHKDGLLNGFLAYSDSAINSFFYRNQTLTLFGFDLNKHYVCLRFMKKLSQLQIGKKGIIKEFTDLEMSLKLMEMGCLPGEEIVIERVAPLGDPIAVNVSGYMLSLRKQEASTIILQ